MSTRREFLGLLPAASLAGWAGASTVAGPTFERIDTHFHMHAEAPPLLAALREERFRVLDIVVCPAIGDEAFDLEAKLDATRAVHRGSAGVVAWASTFDARGCERPGFSAKTIGRLRRTFDDGAVGVKIWKNIGLGIRLRSGALLLPDHPTLLPIYEAIQGAGRTLIAHLAEPDGAWLPLDEKNPELAYYSKNPQWHFHGKPGSPVKRHILEARDRVLARFPKLRVVGCHLGSDEDDLTRLARRLDTYPNLAVDTAARVRYLARGDRESVRRFLARYQDRVLYATDFSLRDGDPAAAARGAKTTYDRDWSFFAGDELMDHAGIQTRGLGLEEGVLRKIFRDNALRWIPGLSA